MFRMLMSSVFAMPTIAGTVAALAIEDAVLVRDVNCGKFLAGLGKDGQVL